MDIYNALKRPFDPKKISWRVGATNADKTKGIALAYIDARDVMQRLDEVFGLNWQCRYSHAEGKTICEIGVKIVHDESITTYSEWIWRAGGAGDTDVEAEKGAISDAFKRAAVLFGIGRYLYNLPNTWVAIKQQGKSYALSENPTLPYWATPEGFDDILAKRIPENSSITPASGVWESMDTDQRIFLQDIANQVIGLIKKGDVKGALEHINDQNLDTDEKVALNTRFDSKQRSAMKKVHEEMKGNK